MKHEWRLSSAGHTCQKCGIHRLLTHGGRVFYVLGERPVSKRAGKCRPPVSDRREKVKP